LAAFAAFVAVSALEAWPAFVANGTVPSVDVLISAPVSEPSITSPSAARRPGSRDRDAAGLDRRGRSGYGRPNP
jgi:hypothetical protein